ncbi:hypothetical protein Cadr_000000827 [Camelus dromedarius]|uniref:Uncharacterized protein n=1 Tax=Camelus dromedarius TaxID=9838 RepID=A0A5N4EKB6_CAMDR|nr:hypothetical protein Cadr_000000827 [Camelus dromedarius]
MLFKLPGRRFKILCHKILAHIAVNMEKIFFHHI